MKKYLLYIFLLHLNNVIAEIKLPAIISDHMVLQQNVPVRIWGTASPDEKIIVSLSDQKINIQADINGKWHVWLKPLKKSRGITMTITGTNTITVKDILIGEVWLASGQSNMEWKVRQSTNAEEEIKNANYNDIRFFAAKKGISEKPLAEIDGKWEICSPAITGNFSAVAYFFGRDIHKRLNTPVGLVETSWGATNCQAWTPAEVFATDPRVKYILDDWSRVTERYPQSLKTYQESMEKWRADSILKRSKGEALTPAPRSPGNPFNKNAPSSIYNATIAPLTNYTIRGVIWYQGEANAYQNVAYPYRYLFPAMITAWRNAWGQGDFPFLFVQLSAMGNHPYWPVLRESQLETLKLKNTGMAVSIDVGDSADAHFKLKQPIGYRLHLIARNLVYGEKTEYSGPMYRQATEEGKSLRLWFDHAKDLKTTDGGPVKGFTVSGNDGIFVPANAIIDGETILINSPSVDKPIAARYAFVDFPHCNLVNGSELPASSFRTDNFIIK